MRALRLLSIGLLRNSLCNAQATDFLNGLTLNMFARVADLLKALPVYSTPLDLWAPKNLMMRWEGDPLFSPECEKFYQSDPSWYQRAQALRARADAKEVIPLVPDIGALANYSNTEMHCLFRLGYSPTRVPLGVMKGRVYSPAGDNQLNDMLHVLWGGKIFSKTLCGDGRELYYATNSALRMPGFHSMAYVGELPSSARYPINSYEQYDGQLSLWLDYSADFEKFCPSGVPAEYDLPEMPKRVQAWLNANPIPLGNRLYDLISVFSPDYAMAERVGLGRSNALRSQRMSADILNNLPSPIHVIDALRWVGRDEQAGIDFYLARIFLSFADGLRTVGWYNLKATDLLEQNELI